MSSHIGPAFRDWALKPDVSNPWYENEDAQTLQLLRDRSAGLRERLADYADEFEIRVADDLRHGACCRACKGLIAGTRADLHVIERDMRAHFCKEKRESAPSTPLAEELRERVDEGADLAPFYSESERAAMWRESQEVNDE